MGIVVEEPFLNGADVPIGGEECPFVEVEYNPLCMVECAEPFDWCREPFEVDESGSSRILSLMKRLRFRDGGLSNRDRLLPASFCRLSPIFVMSGGWSSPSPSDERLRRRLRGFASSVLDEVLALTIALVSELDCSPKYGPGVGGVEYICGAELVGKLEGLGGFGLAGSSGMIGVW